MIGTEQMNGNDINKRGKLIGCVSAPFILLFVVLRGFWRWFWEGPELPMD